MAVLRIDALPGAALDAAADFHDRWLPRIRALTANCPAGDDLALVFAPCDHTHRAWRVAAVQELAREAAPVRVNALAADSEAAIAQSLRYLNAAPGVTGQYLQLDDGGAGSVVGLKL